MCCMHFHCKEWKYERSTQFLIIYYWLPSTSLDGSVWMKLDTTEMLKIRPPPISEASQFCLTGWEYRLLTPVGVQPCQGPCEFRELESARTDKASWIRGKISSRTFSFAARWLRLALAGHISWPGCRRLSLLFFNPTHRMYGQYIYEE